MRSYVVTITKGTKEKNQIKTKIRVGSVVKANFGELDENKRKGINRRIIKEVVGCLSIEVANIECDVDLFFCENQFQKKT